MGEAKRRAQHWARMQEELTLLRERATRVSSALRKLFFAAGSHLGSDCYAHAVYGGILLKDLGTESRTVVGYAAWRVGSGDGDVIAHCPNARAYLPPGAESGLAYHAWLECCDCVIDFTTYLLREKARRLDAADGGYTSVEWCPDFLMLPRRQIRRYQEVAAAPNAGVAYYEGRPELAELLHAQFTPDEADLRAARLILANPDVSVIGPNDLRRLSG